MTDKGSNKYGGGVRLDEGIPVHVPTGVERGPGDQRAQSAVIYIEGGVCGKLDSRVVDGVNFGKCTFACRPVYDAAIVKHGENGQFDEGEFGRRGEGETVPVEETEVGLYFSLKV